MDKMKELNEGVEIKYNNKTFYGYKQCPRWLKSLYLEWANNRCQDCKKKEEEVGELNPYRITKANMGGLFTFVPFHHPLSNVKILCKNCYEDYNNERKI